MVRGPYRSVSILAATSYLGRCNSIDDANAVVVLHGLLRTSNGVWGIVGIGESWVVHWARFPRRIMTMGLFFTRWNPPIFRHCIFDVVGKSALLPTSQEHTYLLVPQNWDKGSGGISEV